MPIQKKHIVKKPVIIANWKISTLTYSEAQKKVEHTYTYLDKQISKIHLYIAPNVAHIGMLSAYFGGKVVFAKKKTSKTIKNKKNTQTKLPKVTFVAQDVSIRESGSFTGEIPVKTIKDLGASKVIIGHSECRERGDTLEVVVQKVKLALQENLDVVLCVGEKERDAGVLYLKTIDEQITSVFSAIQDVHQFSKITIAYEPVWAINNKDNISIDANGLHGMVVYIKKILGEKYGEKIAQQIPIVYGGSVNPENAQDIYWNGEVDGLLIGRASFDPSVLQKVISNILINPKKNILQTYGIHKKNN